MNSFLIYTILHLHQKSADCPAQDMSVQAMANNHLTEALCVLT
jgi:hypothetical protein